MNPSRRISRSRGKRLALIHMEFPSAIL
uniref:Uncharacterized protein n=1 Tax=Anguilla anguilla TaxID=7936 RepID=A0A0E9PQB8_ANGAN